MSLPTGVKQIPRFPKYYATKDGKIWSTFSNKFLRPGLSCGRLTVSLGRNNSELVHRLVLEAFIGPCPAGMEACHADDIPTNNYLSNLRWDTRSNNMKEGYKNGKYNQVGENGGNAKLKEQDVRMIIYMGQTNLFTRKELAKIYHVGYYCIRDILTKRNWKHLWKGN